MGEKKAYLEFRNLLRKCIGNKSQKDFAKESGISIEHLNRMLNNETISQPAVKTLIKIYEASKSAVSYKELLESAGYTFDKENHREILCERRELTLYQRMQAVADELETGFKRMISKQRIYPGFADVIMDYMSNQQVQKVTFSSDSIDNDKQDTDMHNGEMYRKFSAKWYINKDAYTKLRTETYFNLYYVCTSSGNIILTDVAIDGATLMSTNSVPEYITEIFENETNISKLPFISVSEEEKVEDGSPELKLLERIFGKEEDKIDLMHAFMGTGFVYEKTPEGFLAFFLKRTELFRETPEEVELLEEVEDLFDNSEDIDIPTDRLDEIFADYSCQMMKGTGAAVTALINRELLANGKDYFVNYEESEEKFRDTFKPVIYIEEDILVKIRYEQGKGKCDEIENELLSYAKELKVPTFGTAVVYKNLRPDIISFQEKIEY